MNNTENSALYRLEWYDGYKIRNFYHYDAIALRKFINEMRRFAEPGEWYVLYNYNGVLQRGHF